MLPKILQPLAEQLKKHNLTLHPAGRWKFDKEGKKEPIDIYRSTYAPLSKYPNDNMFKISLNRELLVIDVDNRPRSEVEAEYPTLKNTLSSTTTTKEKAHYYLLPPEGRTWTKARTIGINGVDFLSSGIIFEGHLHDNPDSNYTINNLPIQRVTEEEYSILDTLLQKEASHHQNESLIEYTSKAIKYAISSYLSRSSSSSTADYNRLCRAIMNTKYKTANKGRRGKLHIKPTYMNANTIAVKLSYNVLISTELRDQFIDKWITEEWGFNRNSLQTHQRLDKAILPSLPTRTTPDQDTEELIDRLHSTIIDGWSVVKTIVNSDMKFIQLNPDTLIPRKTGQNGGFILTQKTLGWLYESEEEANMATALAQPVTIVDNPYRDLTYYDSEQRIDYLNIANRSEYEQENKSLPTLPDSPLTRAIASYFGKEHTELYLHWLAHTLLAPASPILIPFLVSSKTDEGGTGKSLCASVLPTALIHAVNTLSADTMLSDWGDATASSRLIALNDMSPMSDRDWGTIYGKMRDETSKGMRRKKNMKYAGFVEVTDAYAISVSANFIPKLDAHDRRAWVVLPQHLEYGDTEPVSIEDQAWLRSFEKEHLLTRYEELSELMAYLRHLYSEDKFNEELYRKAPETKGRDMAVSKGTTYSSRIIYSMQTSPQALFELMEDDDTQLRDSDIGMPGIITSADTVTQKQIAQVIVMQYDGNGKVWLPKEFLAEIQHRVASSDTMKITQKHTTVTKLCDALGVDKDRFKQSATQHHFYPSRLKDLPIRMGNYSQRMIQVPMGEPQLEKWKEVANGH